jgi:hypothetical protein
MRRPAIIVQERKPLPVALAMVVARPPTRFPFIYSSTFSDLWIDSSSSDTSTGHDHGADRESHLGRGGQNAKGEGYRTVGVIHIESEIQTENAHLRLAPKVELRTRPDQTRPDQSERRPGSSQAFQTVLARLMKIPILRKDGLFLRCRRRVAKTGLWRWATDA